MHRGPILVSGTCEDVEVGEFEVEGFEARSGDDAFF